MHVTLVEINVKQDKIDEFIDVFRANHLGAIEEPGNLRFDVLQDEHIPTRFYIYEAYRDEQAVAAHKQTPHYLQCVEKLEALMTGPRKKTTFIGLMPEKAPAFAGVHVPGLVVICKVKRIFNGISGARMTLRDRLLALLVVVIWGVNFVVIKFGLQGMPPFLLAGMRFLLVALPAIFFIPRPTIPWKWLLLYGMTMSFAQFAFLFVAIKVGMPAGLASLVLQAQVFFTLLLGVVLMGEKLRVNHFVGIAIASGGMLVLAQASLHKPGSGAVPLAGLLLTLAAAFSWALGNLTNKKILAGFPQRNILSLVVWSAPIPVVPFLACSWLFDGPQVVLASLSHVQVGTWLAIAYLAFAATLFGYSVWGSLLGRYETWRVAPLTLLVPLVGLFAAWLLLDEALSPAQFGGALLVLAGMAVNTFGLPRRRAVAVR